MTTTKRGRKGIRSPKLEKRLCAALSAANTIAVSCALCGVSQSGFYEWRRRGENGEPGFAEFSESVTRARAKAAQRLVAIIQRAAPRDWRAASFLLSYMGLDDESSEEGSDLPLSIAPSLPAPVIKFTVEHAPDTKAKIALAYGNGQRSA